METNKLPTAREFLQQELPHRFFMYAVKAEIHQAMIKFAKIYGKEILKQASEKAIIYKSGNGGSYLDASIDEKSIITAYNLDEIK